MKLKSVLIGTTCLMMAGVPHLATAQEAPVQSRDDANVADQNESSTENRSDGTRPGDIVVTGTRITRPNNKSAAPISTLTSQEIAAQGAVNIEEALVRLPQVAALAEQNNQDSEGRQRVALRNLGFERTLTLVDGLRLGLNNGLDVGILPTQLVERIDVLSGGASSVYGSDAISGVVNFILRKNFDGIGVNVNYNFYNHINKTPGSIASALSTASFGQPPRRVNDGGRADVTLTVGKNLFDDRLNISGFVNYRQANEIPYASREVSACQLTQPTRDGPLACTPSTYTTSGTIQPRAGARAGQLLVNNPNGDGTFVPYGTGPGLAVNPFTDYALQRNFNRLNAGGFLSLKVGSTAELYGSVLYYRDRSFRENPARVLSFTAYGSTPFQVNCNNPFLSASQATAICGAAAGTATTAPIDVRYRFGNLQVEDRYRNEGVRATFGARGTFAESWSWDVAAMYAKSKGTNISTPFPDPAKVNRALNVVNVGGVPTCAAVATDPACIPLNVFRPGLSNPAVFNYLLTGDQGAQSGEPRLWQIVATTSLDLGKYGITSPLAEQGVAFALTGEYRDEDFSSTANAAFRQINGGNDVSRKQHVWEGNVEAQVPLVERRSWTQLLQVNAGYRVSKYNRLDDRFSTWKIEGLWAPIDDITFRVARNKAQRAPTVIELSQALDVSYGRQGTGAPGDICAPTSRQVVVNGVSTTVFDQPPRGSIAACRATGLPDNLYGSASLVCPDNLCTVRFGGFDIKPETAYTTTFGVVLRPRFLPGLTVSVDRYIIDLQDSIGYNYDDFYSNGCVATADSFYCKGIIRNPGTFTLFSPAGSNPTTGFYVTGTTNFFKSKSHGWDIQAQYPINLNQAGRLELLFNGTAPTLSGGQDAPNLPQTNCVGFFGPQCTAGGPGTPRWQHTARATYSTQNGFFSLSGAWRYVSSATLTLNADNPTAQGFPFTAADRRTTFNSVPAYSFFDLSASFAVAKQFNLRIGANNLFDKQAPLALNQYVGGRNNTIPGRYDILGRQILIGIGVNY